jgi:DNA-directed RNA polymerase subunit RPC12/RpoP
LKISELDCPNCGSGLEKLPLRESHKLSIFHHLGIPMDRILKRYACIGCGEEFVSVDWGGIHLELLEEPDYKV